MKKNSNQRRTIPSVKAQARAKIREVAELSGLTAGELVTEAIEYWYDETPEEEDDEPGD